MGTGFSSGEPWRRRCVEPAQVGVYVREGRWGPRRLRVTECAEVITAETVYDLAVGLGVGLRPGFTAAIEMPLVTTNTISDTSDRTAGWLLSIEVLPNPIWRFGRLFFRCPRCTRRITRLYIPVAGRTPECRTCWGLTYASQSWSYHLDGHSRQACYATTTGQRETRRRASRKRCEARSLLWRQGDCAYRGPRQT